jgi:hypothetical protein
MSSSFSVSSSFSSCVEDGVCLLVEAGKISVSFFKDGVCLLVEVVEAGKISVSFFKPNLLLLEDDAADDLFLKFINDS